ncbi:PH domain-containing protein, partial [Oenococcus oeni]
SLILLLIFSFIDALFRYIFFAYRFDENSLTIDSGVFVRHHEHIPFNKIQTIQHKQWFFLQPFGLESLSIETAGHNDGKAEAILPVIPLKISNFIEKLNQQSRLEDVSSEVVPQQAKNKKIDSNYQINFHDLSKYALTSFGIIPTLLGFVGFFSQVDDYLPQSIKKPVESTINSLVAQEFLIILILILLFSLLASYLTTVQKYYHFTLIKSEHKLTTIRGFFQRYVVSLPLKKSKQFLSSKVFYVSG